MAASVDRATRATRCRRRGVVGDHFINSRCAPPLTCPRAINTFMHQHPFRDAPKIPSRQERAMIDLYYWTTPNGHKITMFLEETGLQYKIFPVNIGKGDQFKPEFLAIAPNNRIPALVDHEPKGGGKPLSIFESGPMLLYFAEK